MKNKILRIATALVLTFTSISVFLSKPTPAVYAGSDSGPTASGTWQKERDLTEKNQKKLFESQPPVTIDKSLERANLNARLKFLNDENRIGYVYLLADTGQVISEYTIKGKASSLNSYITQMEQIKCRNDASDACIAAEAPDIDGSYGHNVEGIFFFTTDGSYVEWSGRYVYSSQPLNINTPVSLTRAVQQ